MEKFSSKIKKIIELETDIPKFDSFNEGWLTALNYVHIISLEHEKDQKKVLNSWVDALTSVECRNCGNNSNEQ